MTKNPVKFDISFEDDTIDEKVDPKTQRVTRTLLARGWESATDEAVRFLGKQGRMLPSGKNVKYNALLVGPNETPIWYGDLDTKVDAIRLKALSESLGFPLNVLSLT
jgi:hypothetical protein